MNLIESLEGQYQQILSSYLKEASETALYQGQKMSRKFIEHQTSPEEIIALHYESMKNLFPKIPQEVLSSFDFLLQVMMDYGLAYQEHQSLRDKQLEIKSEIEIAASIQETLLETPIPLNDDLDIGAISMPAKQMNGDYYRFIQDGENIGVAIADVIGKGIPAAMCMSMIKYAMDSLPKPRKCPRKVLENLNRIVENNVSLSMFITMFYGVYDTTTHLFTYASAGHEQGFYYNSGTDSFEDMTTSGLVLGVDQNITYKDYQRKVEPGDMMILLSDGVTETKMDGDFIERSVITELIGRKKHLSAQEIVEEVFGYIEKIQNFQLRDDFTLIILRRKV